MTEAADIVFAWPVDPKRSLSSNGGVGTKWTVSKARDAAKEQGRLAVIVARQRGFKREFPQKTDIHALITFRPPSRRWDRLNMLHLFKSHFDGMAKALDFDDRWIHPHTVYGEPSEQPRVIVRFLDGAP